MIQEEEMRDRGVLESEVILLCHSTCPAASTVEDKHGE